MAYTLPFLIPMLENAGANVFMPRERDWQVHEVVVDNDGSTGKSLYIASDNVMEGALTVPDFAWDILPMWMKIPSGWEPTQ